MSFQREIGIAVLWKRSLFGLNGVIIDAALDTSTPGFVDVGPTWYRTVESAFAELLLLALRSAHAEREGGRPSLTADGAG